MCFYQFSSIENYLNYQLYHCYATLKLSIYVMLIVVSQTKQNKRRKYDNGSCCLHCYTTTISDENLADVTQAEIFMDEVFY